MYCALKRSGWILRRLHSHGFCNGSGEASSLNVSKILGLFGNRPLQAARLDASQVLTILQNANWKARLEELLKQQTLSPLVVEQVVMNCPDPNIAMSFFQWSSRQDSSVRTVDAYNCLMAKFVDAQLVIQARSVLEDLKYAGLTPNVRSFCILIRGHFQSGNCEGACSQLDEMQKLGLVPNTVVYNHIMYGLCKAGKLAEAESYFKGMPENSKPNGASYSILIDGYCKASDFNTAFAYLKKMQKVCHWFQPHAYSSIIMGLCQTGNASNALELFRCMREKHIEPSIININVLLSGLCRSGRLDDAREVFRSFGDFRCKPTVVTYNTMVAGLCKAGQLDKAICLLDEMKKVSLDPTFVTYTALIDYCIKFGKLDQAYQVFQDMAQGPDVCSVPAFCNLFDGLQRAGKLAEALHVYREMGRKGVKLEDRHYSVLVHGLSKMEGRVLDAHALVCEMLNKGIIPNTVAFNVFLSKLCNEGGLDEAINLVGLMKKTGFEPDTFTYNTVIHALCEVSRVEEAQDLFLEMRRLNITMTAPTYGYLIDGQFRLRQMRSALDLIYEMLGRGFIPRITTLNKMLDLLLQQGKSDEALRLYESVSDEGIVSDEDGFHLLVFPHVHSYIEDGEQLFESAVAKGLSPSIHSCNVLLDSQCKAGRLDRAMELFQEMKAKCKPNVNTYNIMIHGLCARRQMDEAYCLFGKMDEEGVKPTSSTYNFLIDGFLKAEELDSAQMLFKKMQRGEDPGVPPPSLITYDLIIRHLCETGKTEEAMEIFGVMRDKGFTPRVTTSEAVLHNLCQVGWLKDAFELYEELPKADNTYNLKCCNVLLDGILRTGNLDRAMDFTDYMIRNGIAPNRSTYATMLEGLCAQGMVDEAHKMVVELVKQGERPHNQSLRVLLDAFCKRGDFAGAYGFYCWMPEVGIELTLSMHHIFVEKLLKMQQFDYLEMIERRGVPDVIMGMIEEARASFFKEREFKLYEQARDKKWKKHGPYGF